MLTVLLLLSLLFTCCSCELDTDECVVDRNPCVVGTCVNFPGSYNCSCPAGFEGRHCEMNIDDCILSSCQNGGTCNDGANHFTCTCPARYLGATCTIFNTTATLGRFSPKGVYRLLLASWISMIPFCKTCLPMSACCLQVQ